MSIICHNMHGITIGQRQTDGYINATEVAKAYESKTGTRKDVAHWLATERSKAYISYLSENTGMSDLELVEQRRGRNGGTWMHPELAVQFLEWLGCKNNKQTEKSVANALQLIEGGTREVLTEIGKIDLLTATEIIEVKHVSKWKAGIGQVLVYSHYYKSHRKRLHLFGDCHESFLPLIQKHCKKFNINLTWEVQR